MIIPSIDLQGGRAVQLEGGKALKIDGGDPLPWIRRFRLAGEVAVIDLDAAMGKGSNAPVVETLLREARCRVGGGIRDATTARTWLDRGAERVILGTAARPEILRELPRERTIAALDAVQGEVMVHGWQTRTGQRLEDRMKELAPYVGGFLITFIEREGRMVGIDEERIAALVSLAADVRITFAGGVASAADVAAIDRLGGDAQVGMALYSGRLELGDAIVAPLRSDRPDGLIPTVIVDIHGRHLGLVYSSRESVREAVHLGRGVYHSRSRGGLWYKGASSGDWQELLEIRVDCDRDALEFIVRQHGRGFCHTGTAGCFGELRGLASLERAIQSRKESAPVGSYTRRLFDDPDLLNQKLTEEAQELVAARTAEEATWEAADLLYFTLVKMVSLGASLEQVEAELRRRSLKVERRPGNAKPEGSS
ncbi:MAG: phosphoribosyl-ATP diphosphatase [Myxococcales bacterium]|nr:phosphoribosyl-ATP diphosphatase [Polyangiaceae bacterium]MDW8251041.1 phosphoribosyl-ATP diphosphatase [Myxococcales bacterium]